MIVRPDYIRAITPFIDQPFAEISAGMSISVYRFCII